MYLDRKPVLHVVDAATGFQAARFIRNMSAKKTWDVLKECWIDTYLGPPDIITYDAGTNFNSTKFRNEVRLIKITYHQIPIKVYWSINKVKEYYGFIRKAYKIIIKKLSNASPKLLRLQIAIKVINNTANPNGLVPTLLIFKAYPKININLPPTFIQTQKAQTV